MPCSLQQSLPSAGAATYTHDMADEGDAYRLKWQTHVPSLCTEFMELRKNESYVDVTLICRGGELKGKCDVTLALLQRLG